MTLPPQISSYGGRMPQTEDNLRNGWVDKIHPEKFLRTLGVHGCGLTDVECDGKLSIHTAIGCHLFDHMHTLSKGALWGVS